MAQNGLTFSHSVGYRGICSIGKPNSTGTGVTGTPTTILCTGGNISLNQDPIMGSGVWGAGYQNVAPIAYAYNYLSLEGSSSFELTTDANKSMWNTLKDACVYEKTAGVWLTMLPDGHNGFEGLGWASSLSYEASEGSAVTGSFNFKGDPSGQHGSITADGDEGWGTQTIGSTGSDEQKFGKNGQNVSPFAGPKLVPYWRTGMGFAGSMGSDPADTDMLKDITTWSVNYNSDLQMLKCCRYETESPLSADYILVGEASAEGSYTIFRLSGDFAPGPYHKKRENLTFLFNLAAETAQGGDGGPNVGAQYGSDINHIQIPFVLISSGSTSMTTGSQYITAEFSFTGIGNGKDPIITMT